MAEQRVSYRYAKALFESVVEQQIEERVYNDLLIILQILKLVPELRNIAKKPLISPIRKKKLYQEVFSDKVTQPTLNFIIFLVDKDRDYLLRDIILQFQKLYFEYKGYLPVEIYLPKEFDENIKQSIIDKIAKNTGKKIIPKFIIDPSIIGGFKIKIDDWVYDASLRNKLNALHQELISSIKVS